MASQLEGYILDDMQVPSQADISRLNDCKSTRNAIGQDVSRNAETALIRSYQDKLAMRLYDHYLEDEEITDGYQRENTVKAKLEWNKKRKTLSEQNTNSLECQENITTAPWKERNREKILKKRLKLARDDTKIAAPHEKLIRVINASANQASRHESLEVLFSITSYVVAWHIEAGIMNPVEAERFLNEKNKKFFGDPLMETPISVRELEQ